VTWKSSFDATQVLDSAISAGLGQLGIDLYPVFEEHFLSLALGIEPLH
jgi:hypothetical protein